VGTTILEPMTISATAAQRERHVWRALVFALAVLAQLLLPAIMLRAQAIAAGLCVTGGDGSNTGSDIHAHDQQCAHCRLHDCSPLAPPPSSTVAPARLAVGTIARPEPASFALRPSRTQPPPTGPPGL
jgi:hypothetical protein